MEAIHIRLATQDDFDCIYDFINALENETFDRNLQREIFFENAGNPDNIYLVAWAHRIPVGFLSCHIQDLLHHGGPVGEIQEMYVSENAQGNGIGKLLMDNLKELAIARGILQLEVTSNHKREAAHRFYVREGFGHTHKKFTHPLK